MPALASDALLSSGDMPPMAMAWSTPGIPRLMPDHFIHDPLGPFQGRAVGQLHGNHHIALIFRGNEAGGNPRQPPAGNATSTSAISTMSPLRAPSGRISRT